MHFHGITSGRHFYDLVDQAGDSMSALLVPSLPPWAFQCLSLHVCQRSRMILLFTGRFQGMISFQEVLQDPRRHANAKNSMNFYPCCEVLLLQMPGSTFQGEIRVSVAQACCLEYKCEWPTDCLLPNWKCSVGINWHGIIPRRKKRERNLTAHFFFKKKIHVVTFI